MRDLRVLLSARKHYMSHNVTVSLSIWRMDLCCSLVVETIPTHKDFKRTDPQYKDLRRVCLHATDMQDQFAVKILNPIKPA